MWRIYGKIKEMNECRKTGMIRQDITHAYDIKTHVNLHMYMLSSNDIGEKQNYIIKANNYLWANESRKVNDF